jgi:hypothetical protein
MSIISTWSLTKCGEGDRAVDGVRLEAEYGIYDISIMLRYYEIIGRKSWQVKSIFDSLTLVVYFPGGN